MGELERADLEVVDGELDELGARAGRRRQDPPAQRRDPQRLRARPKTGKPITVRFRFLASPVELLGDADGHVRAVRIERNAIAARDDGRLAARGTGAYEEIPAQLVFRSIGYRGGRSTTSRSTTRGLIRNAGGRVIGDDGAPLPGEYVSGWIKRGPSGVIGTNKKDSQDTVAGSSRTRAAGRLNRPARDDIDALVAEEPRTPSPGRAGRRSTPSSARRARRRPGARASSSPTGRRCARPPPRGN